jgi:hypothetical protein
MSQAPLPKPIGNDNIINSKDSCKGCLYTGVGTCSGLSLYFLKLATELNVPSMGTTSMMRSPVARHKYFLLFGSAAWASAGAYRYYLG